MVKQEGMWKEVIGTYSQVLADIRLERLTEIRKILSQKIQGVHQQFPKLRTLLTTWPVIPVKAIKWREENVVMFNTK
jgi:hypothetical protein